ncbi:type IV secretion system protein VirB3 [Luteimonas sp. e5]
MRKHILFRGCTRPPMFLGVPYVPFFIGAGGALLFAMYTNLLFLIFVPVVIFIMRMMAKRDELIFRLLGLWMTFRMRARNMREHDGLLVLNPNPYRSKPARKD